MQNYKKTISYWTTALSQPSNQVKFICPLSLWEGWKCNTSDFPTQKKTTTTANSSTDEVDDSEMWAKMKSADSLPRFTPVNSALFGEYYSVIFNLLSRWRIRLLQWNPRETSSKSKFHPNTSRWTVWFRQPLCHTDGSSTYYQVERAD